ncbi:hypothetical protein HNQ00_001669 [Flavobacterium sp. 14A]|nr:hypothetical protein [Flavobacterium sp. 14A]
MSVIKDFCVKRILNNNLHNVKHSTSEQSVKTVGIIVDQSYFLETDKLINAIVKNGIPRDAIAILVFNDKQTKAATYPVIKHADLGWNAQVNGIMASDFLNKKFDLLISYYELDRGILLAATFHSKAHFKVGFAAIDKRYNDLIIQSKLSEVTVFIQEVFKYLKILNKI